MSATVKTAVELLDQVNSLAQLEAIDVDTVVARLAEEVAGNTAEQADPAIRAALTAVDSFTSRAMRIRIDHSLADDTTVPRQFRTYLAAEVTAFAGDLDRLRARAQQVLGDSDVSAAIVGAAEQVLAIRAALRQGIIALVPPPLDEPPEPEPEPEPEAHFFDNIELD